MKPSIKQLLVLFVAVLFVGSLWSQSGLPMNGSPAIGTDAKLCDQAGLDHTSIASLIADIHNDSFPNIHSLLIYDDGHILVEEYFDGRDQIWGDDIGLITHGPDVLHDMRSVSKSVVSACIGIAIAQGMIQNVDQHVFDFFPEYEKHRTGARANLKIQHLLAMSSGLEWDESIPYTDPKNSEIQMSFADDPMEFVLSRPMVADPGEQWTYNGGTTQLLATIIQKVSGKNVAEFAAEYLFAPLGIEEYTWTKIPEAEIPAAASGLRLTTRDMLKFGLLYMKGGKWNGKQLLDKSWVEASLNDQVIRNERGGTYGYQFWIWSDELNSELTRLEVAIGNGDQRIFLDRRNERIVITTAGNYNIWDIDKNAYAILLEVYDAYTD